ncbi:hypothetical protein GR247_37455 [Rhizobium leguminosarum]|nr:hypothetical protein [Rhizobium leguminosarum]
MSITVLGSTSGAQNTAVSMALKVGSTGKSQPPALSDHVRQVLTVRVGVIDFSVVALIVGIAAQPFPCEVAGDKIVQVVVRRMGSPP